jgi:multiple sugar transport system substrate-binding protein
MSEKKEEKKINRRTYLKYTGAAIGGLVVGGALGYLLKPSEVIEKTVTGPAITTTETKTVTIMATPTVTTLPPKPEKLTFLDSAGATEPEFYAYKAGPEFAKRYGIKFEPTLVPWDALRDKIVTNLIGHTGAFDVMAIFEGWLPEIAELLEPIDKWLIEEEKKDYVEAALSRGSYEGIQYGLPEYLECRTIIYNKEMFEKEGISIPKTWSEFIDVAQRLTKDINGDGKIDVWGFLFPAEKSMIPGIFEQFAWSKGGGTLKRDEHGFVVKPYKILIDSKESIETMELIKNFIKTWKTTPEDVLAWVHEPLCDEFIAERAAMTTLWPYQQPLLNDPATSKVVGKWGIFNLPIDPKGWASVMSSTVQFCIPIDSKNKRWAFELANFFTSSEIQEWIAKEIQLAPIRYSSYKKVREDPTIGSIIEGWFKANEKSWPEAPLIPEWPRIADELALACHSVILEEKEPESACKELAEKIVKILKI